MMTRTRSTGIVALVVSAAAFGCSARAGTERVEATAEQLMNEALTAPLSSPDPWVRAEAIRLYSLTGGTGHEAALRSGLADAHGVVRASSIEALLPSGDSAAQDAALSLIVQAEAQGKSEMLALILREGTEAFRATAAATLLRDRSPDIRRRTLLQILETRLDVDVALREQLVNDSDPHVADAAFAYMVAVAPDEALDRVLRGLRSGESERRSQSLAFARHLTSADLWPTMRAYLLSGDPSNRFAAQCVLGRLGDPTVEEALRTVLLTGEELDAALALEAMSHIRTERAESQALRQSTDPRLEVRSTALDILIRRQSAPTLVEPFLSDVEPALGRTALLYIVERDLPYAVARVGRMITQEETAARVLRSLYQASREHDLSGLIRALQPQLDALASSPDPMTSDLASRLVIAVTEPANRFPDNGIVNWPAARVYATLEAQIATPDAADHLALSQALRHDLVLIRLAAALSIQHLGDAFTYVGLTPTEE